MTRPILSVPLALWLCGLTGPAPEAASGPAAAQEPTPVPDKPPAAQAPVRNIGGPGDYGLREKLIKQLSNEPQLANAGFKVILVNGGAVFSGTVPSWTVKRRALLLAGVARGIVNVTDQMQVRRADVPDDEILKLISGLLKDRQEALGIKSFEVEVQSGEVTLSGTVQDFAARVRAEELVGAVRGVTQIVNRLRPANAPSGTDDASLRKSVVAYLGNPRAYPYRGEIQVRVKDARVVLTGRLPYFLARQQAGVMAALVGGVGGVDNHIKVDPSVVAFGIDVKELP